ncbi:nuclear transport factor 2 family protein [Mucilaginibacter sabulilitoris]|uniref:Nuclear transport factor 2 family protein n=1 Tax=Mucilaginibacter sabulilitoris TaxID=1173583 RepID=A0ABZ0TT27_9SPHI|nr:nuclear transport factor 2 family protein [Mucilaginibacter sabulilitoris]WPU96151.1 nuclear transport factor 2 family protein [Mucilaginibacter sabulilitoris]
MKILRTLTLSLVLLTGSVALKAAPVKTDEKSLTIKDVVNTYVRAMAHGLISDFESTVDQNAKFILLRGKNMLSYSKAEMLTSLLETQGYDQNCAVDTSVASNGEELVVAKIDMYYQDLTRTNYVTMVNTPGGWKITEVYSVFK